MDETNEIKSLAICKMSLPELTQRRRMKPKRRLPPILIPTIIMGLLAVALLVICYQKGVHIQSLKTSWGMLLQMLPLLVFAIIVAGAVQHLVPSELISKWIGTGSGIKGILIGTGVGCVTPGGPYVSLPIAAGLVRAGASVGTMVAFMTAWSLMELSRLTMEIGIMGWKFALIRLSCSFFFAPIAGLLANTFFSRVRLF